MKKRKLIIIFSVVLLIFLSPFLVSKVARISNDMKMTSVVDYIEISSTGKKIYIKSIKTIESTIWKGSYDGILHIPSPGCKHCQQEALRGSVQGRCEYGMLDTMRRKSVLFHKGELSIDNLYLYM